MRTEARGKPSQPTAGVMRREGGGQMGTAEVRGQETSFLVRLGEDVKNWAPRVAGSLAKT